MLLICLRLALEHALLETQYFLLHNLGTIIHKAYCASKVLLVDIVQLRLGWLFNRARGLKRRVAGCVRLRLSFFISFEFSLGWRIMPMAFWSELGVYEGILVAIIALKVKFYSHDFG